MIFLVLMLGVIPAQEKTAVIPLSSIQQDKIGQTATVEGRILNVLPPRSEKAPYNLYLTDGSDTLLVVIWEDVFKAISGVDKLKPGANVRLTGTVNQYRGNLQFTINKSQDMILPGENAQASESQIDKTKTSVPAQSLPDGILSPGRIDRTHIGQEVVVQGRVKEYKPSWSETAPYSITLQDDSGTLRVVYWSDVAKVLGSSWEARSGQILRIRGKVSEYKQNLQLRVSEAKDIVDAATSQTSGSESNPLIIPVEELSQAYVGKYVRVTGTIEKITPAWMPTAPNTIILADDKARINVVYWADVADVLKPEQKPQNGQTIQVEGKLKEFKSELQIKIYKAADLVPLKSGNSSINSPGTKTQAKPVSQSQSGIQEGSGQNAQILPLGSVTREYLDKYVKVQGKIAEITPSWMPSAPNSVVLSDGQARIKVVYWSDVADKLSPEQKPAIDAVLLVEGKLDEYRGELQIKVEKPEKISLVK